MRVVHDRILDLSGRIGKIPQVLWGPLFSGGLILIVGLMALLMHRGWLFPSVGPTAYMYAVTPREPAVRFYNVFVGHMIGMLSGFLAVVLFGAQHVPAVASTHILSAPRFWASVVAMILCVGVGLALKAFHPPAAATTLLIALGGFEISVVDAVIIVVGVLITAGVAEVVNRLRIGPGITPSG